MDADRNCITCRHFWPRGDSHQGSCEIQLPPWVASTTVAYPRDTSAYRGCDLHEAKEK